MIDIITVTSYDRKYFELNYKLTKDLNKNFKHNWIVVENISREKHGNYFPNNRNSKLKENNIEYIKGIIQDNDNSKILKKNNLTYSINPKRSTFHAEGLSIGIKESKAKYLLIIDPDFFVIKENWLKEQIDFMEQNNIDIISAPYHPVKDWIKPKNIPTVYFLLINSYKISKDQINFFPPLEKEISNKKKIFQNKISFDFFIKFFIYFIGSIFGDKNRYLIGSLGDTGYNLGNLKKDSNCEFLSPAINKIKDLGYNKLLLDFFVNDKYKIIHKRNNFSFKTFKNFKLYDFRKIGCQEYFWKKNPFAFHLRGSIKPFDKNIDELDLILKDFLKKS